MRNFPLKTEVIYTGGGQDPRNGVIGTIEGERWETGVYKVKFGEKDWLTHEDNLCEASEYMKEKAMENYLIPLDNNSVILDTETTGLSDIEICEISIIDSSGNVLLDSLIKPIKPIPEDATAIHGISNEMVADAPTFAELNPEIIKILSDKKIIIYNAQFDVKALISAAEISKVDASAYRTMIAKSECAMLAYSRYYGEPGKYSGNKWHKLVAACEQQHIDISSITAHRAKADCLMTLALIKNCKYKYGDTAMETQNTQLSPAVDLTAIVRNTNAIIEINVPTAISYIDQRVAEFTGESEELETELRKWFKDLGDKRLELTRPVNESLKQVIADEKQIGIYLEKIFAANQAKRDAAEAERRSLKRPSVMVIMAEMLNNVDLPAEYLAKVVFKEEYYQKTMVNKKLRDSIQEQIDTQVNLYNGWLAQQELNQQKIKNREMLIDSLNKEFGFTGTYSNFPIETYNDEQVRAAYQAKKDKQDAEEAQKQAKAAQAVDNKENTNPVDKSPQNPSTGQSEKIQPMQRESSVEAQNKTNDNQTMGTEHKSTSDMSEESILTKTFTITIDAGSTERSAGAMATVEKRLAEMRDNFATKYGVKMEICQS